MWTFDWLLSIMSAMWKKDSTKSPATGNGVRLIGLVVNAARERNDVVSDRRREKSTWRPQCSELLPEWDMLPSGGVRIRSVLEATTCGASHVPTGQWMCQS